MAVKNRALTLATAGVLAGSAIALATNGFIQTPVAVEKPQIEAPAIITGGGTYVDYKVSEKLKLLRYRFESEFNLFLRSETAYRVLQESLNLHDTYVAKIWLELLSDTTATHRDQGLIDAAEEEMILMYATKYFWS